MRYGDRYLRIEVLNTGPSVLTGGRGARAGPGRGCHAGARAGRPARAGRRLRRRPRRPAAARRRLPGPRPHPAGTAVTGIDLETAPRVLIADDQALVRDGFRMILAARGIDVVGEAADGVEAVTAVRRAAARRRADGHPDADDGRPRGHPADPRRPAPHCRVIILTTFDLDRYVYAALAAGASGFLLKDVTPGAPGGRRHAWSPPATPCSPRPSPGAWSSGSPPTAPRRLGRPPRPLGPDPARARGPHADGPGPVQRRAGRAADPERGDREDARGPDLRQARACATGPRPSSSRTRPAWSPPATRRSEPE